MAPANASTSPAGTSQPCFPGCTSSGMPATKVLMIGRRSAMASIMTIGRPSAKLGNTRARAARISSLQLLAADPTGDAHLGLQLVVRDQRFDIAAHFAVANQDQLEIRPLCCKTLRGLDQQQLPFLLASIVPRKPGAAPQVEG